MPKWLRRKENEHGEWNVSDLVRGYRICAYNDAEHGGPHLHRPPEAPAGAPLSISGPGEAEDIVKAFARESLSFEDSTFREFVRKWRSRSKND